MLKEIKSEKIPKDKAQAERILEKLGQRLYALSRRAVEAGLPIVIGVEGWDTSGKSSVIGKIIDDLDPRTYKVHPMGKTYDIDSRMPALWRFFTKVPPRGQIALYDGTWYQDVSSRLLMGQGQVVRPAAFDEINSFESTLTANGVLVIKLFLHIGRDEMEDRMEKLQAFKETRWRVGEDDIAQLDNYDRLYDMYEGMINATSTSHAPWHIINAKDKRARNIAVLEVIVEAIENALDNATTPEFQCVHPCSTLPTLTLSSADLSQKVGNGEYKARLKECQNKLRRLHNIAYQKKIPVVVVYEGWDAGGKGGSIKRVVRGLDPCGYTVVPVAAPSKEELARHYMWRFWSTLPKSGHFAFYDRSWYGRVMVERVEGFCTPEECERAYDEILDFEYMIHNWGGVVVKLWLHIDKEEQLARFTQRQETPEKQWKITEDDWRNREKWDVYEEAVEDMLARTHTQYAPWTVVEGNDKKFARLKSIETVINALEAKLKQGDKI